MKKKTSLSAALKQASGSPPSTKPANEASNGRQGKKAITGFFDPAVSRQLKRLALDKESSIQDLMRDALNDLFEKHGQSKIA